jgi:hypothetical protein
MNKVEGNTLPCGYVMGVHGALASGIPGLKSETWGTLRVFPLALVGKENSHTGLSPYPSSTDALLFLELLASELRIACVHQRGVNDRAQNCFRLIPLASNCSSLMHLLQITKSTARRVALKLVSVR